MKTKSKYIKLVAILVVALTLTGCAQRLQDDNKKVVTNKATGQSLTENILCQPTNEDVIDLYTKNNVDITKLPVCADFNLTDGGYEGIWTTIFVKPLVWLLVQIGNLVKNYGLSIIATTLIIRFVMSPFTKKAAIQSENMKKAKPELDQLEKKYKDNQNNDAVMAKSQEMMAIYKKYSISPAAGCLFSIIQIPLFFAYYEAIQRLPVIFESNFIGFDLGTNPATALANGQFQYLFFIILIVLTTYYSFMMTSADTASMGQENQMKNMMKFMVVAIFISSIFLPTGLAVYWVTNSTFTIVQNIINKRRLKK